jgi:hypothetical protein
MKERKNSNDHYPLYLDVPDINGLMNDQDMMNSVKLIRLACENGLSAFQCMVLIIKNAFEGHVYLTLDLSPVSLMEYGTSNFDLKTGKSKQMILDFCENIELYYEGFKTGWDQIREELKIEEDVCFEAMIDFILANQLLRFPVTILKSYDISAFKNLTTKQKQFLKFGYLLSLIILRTSSELKICETINSIYEEKFRTLLLKLGSKEELLMQLSIKLVMANDPMIRTKEELEQQYFEYIVATGHGSNRRRTRRRIEPGNGISDKSGSPGSMDFRIRQLYRAISKNCRESHTTTEGAEGYPVLNSFFMEANTIYIDHSQDMSEDFLRYFELIDVFCRVINYRKFNDLPVCFIDFTGIEEPLIPFKLNEEILQKIKVSLDNKTSTFKGINSTSFKISHITDNELTEIHVEYLKKQICFLDQRIEELVAEINSVIRAKTGNIRVH